MASQSLVLGLDQGGTKTAAVISDINGGIVGYGFSGGAWHATSGMDTAMAAAKDAVTKALKSACADMEAIEYTVAGMAGADWPYEYALLLDNLTTALGSSPIRVVNDSIICMRAGTSAPYGAVICAGTGSNVAVRSPEGKEYIFGYYIPMDEQGGISLGRKVLRAVFDAEAGMAEPTALTGAVMDRYGVDSVDDLLYKSVSGEIPDDDVKHLAITLFEAADKGDGPALNIISAFGSRMGRYAAAGLSRLKMLDMEVDVVLSGSIFKAANPVLADSVSKALHETAPLARLTKAKFEPVIGAVIIAIESVTHTNLSQPALARLMTDSKKFGLYSENL